MISIQGILSLLGPWLLGFALVWRILERREMQFRFFFAAGLGFFVGFALIGLGTMGMIGLDQVPLTGVLSWLPVIGACGMLAVPARSAQLWSGADSHGGDFPGITWLFTGFVLAYGVLFFINATIPPAVGWDTWQSWLPRPIVWYHLGEAVEFVNSKEWLTAERVVYRLRDPTDPNLVPALLLWGGGFGDTWNSRDALAIWPMVWMASACLLVGTARAFGCRWPIAVGLGACFALTPFPTMQAAIPGYADIWVAGFLLSAIAWLKLAHDGSRPAMIFLGLTVLALLLAKDGMAFWLAMLALAWIGTLVSATWWRAISLTAVAVVILSISLMALGPDIGISSPVPIGYEEGSVPRIFYFMFLTGDWSLIFWLLPVPIAWTWVYPGRCSSEVRFLAGFTVVALACLWVIFTCTPRAEGAVTGEIINRALLHGVPAFLLMMAVVMERVCADRIARSVTARDQVENPTPGSQQSNDA